MFPFTKKNSETKSCLSSSSDFSAPEALAAGDNKKGKSSKTTKGLLRLLKSDRVQSESFQDPFLIAEEKHGYGPRSCYSAAEAADHTLSFLSDSSSEPFVGMVIVVDDSQEQPQFNE